MKVVIIGNGAAGISAAGTLRKNNPDIEILILSDESYPHYSRPRVIELLSGEVKPSAITIKKTEWYDKNKINLEMGVKVTAIDVINKKVQASNNIAYEYDKLIIAAGANSFLPPVKGNDSEGVFSLRTIEDANTILKYASDKKQAVVIGGGLLGIEAAAALSQYGLKVTVVEMFDYLLPRQLDPESSEFLRGIIEKKGLKFMLGMKTQQIRKVSGNLTILFEDEATIETDLILFSAGIRCNLDIVKGIDIEVDKGIKVNKFMLTNNKDIYACGDIAEFEGVCYGIWPAALEQGRIAALNISGDKTEYEGTITATKLKVVGVEMASVGNITPDDETKSAIYNDEQRLKKVFIKDQMVVGGILVGNTEGYSRLQKMIKSKTKYAKSSEVLKEL